MPWFAPPFRVVLAAPPAAEEGACAAASSSPAGRIRGCEAALLRCIDGGGGAVGEQQNCTRCYNLLQVVLNTFKKKNEFFRDCCDSWLGGGGR